MILEVLFTYCEDADQTIESPAKQTPGSAGFDIRANLQLADRVSGISVSNGGVVKVPTGIMLALPDGIVCDVRSRSGLAKSSGVIVLNAPGTIDPDFRGEVVIILINHGNEDKIINHGERIAQLVFLHSLSPKMSLVDELCNTERGENGFGSTGKS